MTSAEATNLTLAVALLISLNVVFWPTVERAMDTHADTEKQLRKATTPDGVVIGADLTLTSGLDVTVIRDDGSRWLTRTRSDPWQIGGGTWVISLEGRAGGYALDRVRRRREGDER